MSRGIAITLIATLLSCPLLCVGGATAAHGESHGCVKHCGCCSGGHSAEGADPSEGGQNGSRPGHSCQCICGGAVVDDAGVVTIDFDWDWSVPLVPLVSVASQIQEAGDQPVSLAPWPDVGMNHGRALCCLFNTYLC